MMCRVDRQKRSPRSSLLINPDLWLFLNLEEKTSGVWWDLPKGTEAMRQHVIEPGDLEIIEIRVEYLSKYLQARRMSLLVRHIRRLQVYNPPQEMIDRFEENDEKIVIYSQSQKGRSLYPSAGDHKCGRQRMQGVCKLLTQYLRSACVDSFRVA
jgi:hypothetical protein